MSKPYREYTEQDIYNLKKENEFKETQINDWIKQYKLAHQKYMKLQTENEELKKYVEPCYNPKTGEIEGYLCNVTMGFVKGNEYKKALDEIEEIVNKHYATILEFYKAIKKIQQRIKEVKGE